MFVKKRRTKIKVCQDHLVTLYQALQKGDTGTISRVERQLTSKEKCVACTYLLKSEGEAKEALEDYLRKQGSLPNISRAELIEESVVLPLRIILFLLVLMGVYIAQQVIKNILIASSILKLQPSNIWAVNLSLYELSILIIVSLPIFLYINDIF